MTFEEFRQWFADKSKDMGRPVYRGQSQVGWPLESGAIRRLRSSYGENYPSDESELQKLISDYHFDELLLPMEIIDSACASMTDLQKLSKLQHFGAGTNLLDFTESPLVALWFACTNHLECDAKVFVLDIDDTQVFINARLNSHQIESEGKIVYFEPDFSLSSRIIAQRSLFVIGSPGKLIQHAVEVRIPKASKPRLNDSLNQMGYSQTSLFCDVPGLAQANSAKSPLKVLSPLTANEHRKRGNRAYQVGRYDYALAEYKAFAAKLPNVAQPNCLKGDALAMLERFQEADIAYTKAIDNIGQPISSEQKNVVIAREVGEQMLRTLHYNRGNVRAAIGNHDAAIVDYNFALELGFESPRNVLKNRGNSKFVLKQFSDAYQDFEDAWLVVEGSDAALAMGNCKMMLGEFECAGERFALGVLMDQEGTARGCRENAEQLRLILNFLNGRDFEVEVKEEKIVIEVADLPGHQQQLFSFVGNQNNTGNYPSGMSTAHGGKGYKGIVKGFVVEIKPAD